MYLKKIALSLLLVVLYIACTNDKIQLSHGVDETAGGSSTYIISTPTATYYLEKEGGGLSSMIDNDGVDWIGFHNEKGSGHKGEYRGFPNAINRQDGSYFHAMNAGTDSSSSIVELNTKDHIRIIFTSDNKQWEGRWDFYPDRCDFTMIKISPGYKYWVLYEGVPGGEMNTTDYWYASIDNKKHPITEPFSGDLPSPEWMAFGDENSSFMIYLLHHQDDNHPDNYVQRPDMTVLGFGRQNLEETTKHLTTVQTFSIGFLPSTEYFVIDKAMKTILE
tara:strand:- start:40334 stop:41161 length:828 start_codon:yes stop_codon:yes gene_type:complete